MGAACNIDGQYPEDTADPFTQRGVNMRQNEGDRYWETKDNTHFILLCIYAIRPRNEQ